jgi:hypothetical protein
MSKGSDQADQPIRFNLRRSIYGWSGLGIFALSVACLAYWITSFKAGTADFAPVYIGGKYLSVEYGVIRIHNDQWPTVGEMLSLFRNADPERRARELYPGTSSEILANRDLRFSEWGFSLPGLNYRCIEFKSGELMWMLSMSTLVPFGVAALLAVFCLNRYLATMRSPKSTTPK